MLCKKCGNSNKDEFYKSSKSECKKCAAARVRENRLKRIEYYREYDRKRSNNPDRVELRKKTAERWKKDPELRKRTAALNRDWQEKNKVKRAAHVITGNAIRSGKLTMQPCMVCGEAKSEAHHEDYNKPLDVMWLCRKHHAELHRAARAEERAKNKCVSS